MDTTINAAYAEATSRGMSFGVLSSKQNSAQYGPIPIRIGITKSCVSDCGLNAGYVEASSRDMRFAVLSSTELNEG